MSSLFEKVMAFFIGCCGLAVIVLAIVIAHTLW